MVGIIILNYNGSDDTLECISTIKKNIKCEYRIIVVDNNSKKDEAKKLSTLDEADVVVIYHNENGGYAVGNNIGIRYALKFGCDYLCILNNDTIIEEDFLTPCVSYLNKYPNVGFIGPAILNILGNEVQSTGGDIVIKKGIVTQKNNGMPYEKLQNIIDCDYVSGACMICRASLIEKIGCIPEQYFLFFEETEWCYKAIKYGKKNLILGDTYIRHKESASISKVGSLKDYLMTRNRVVFVRRNANMVVYISFLLYAFLQASYRAIRYDCGYWHHISYLWDGITNRINKRFPFIKVCD